MRQPFYYAFSAGQCAISSSWSEALDLWGKNVAAANGMAVPVGLVLALLPMLARFNDGIAKAAEYTYSGQISHLLEGGDVTTKAICVMAAYFAAQWAVLLFLFRRGRME